MLHEVKSARGTQDAADLGQCPVHGGDSAQRQDAHHVVDACVLKRQRLGVHADVLDRHRARRHPFRRQLARHGRRIDRSHALHGRRVVRHVQTRPEADFKDLATEPSGDPGSQPCRLVAAQHTIRHTRKDLLLVETHLTSLGRPASSIKNPMAPPGAPLGALPVQGRQPV